MPAPVPFFSIILVCRNPGPRLQVALGSVWAQRDAAYETIVIDGASTDGTREWLETQRPRIATLRSEPDRGIYDAMNKGLAAASGEWVLFLGADDRFASDSVLREAQTHLYGATAGVVVGTAGYDDGRIYGLGASHTALRRNFAHHQAAFYRRELFTAHGDFQTGWRIMGDYEFNLRLLKAGVSFRSMPLRIAACASGGRSDAGGWTGYREEIQIRHGYFPAWRCWPWNLVTLARCLRKKLLHRLTHG